MKSPAPLWIGVAIGFAVVIAGLFLGLHFADKKPPRQPASVTAQSAAAIPPNPNIFDVSPPSRATLSKTKAIDIPSSRPIAFVMLEKDEAVEIETGQQVLLYDMHGTLIETFGTVRDVKEGSGPFENMLTIHIALDNQDGVDTSKAAKGAIIVGRNPDAARLPLSALVRDDNDEPHVWRADTDRDGKTVARFEKINVVSATYDFFVIEETSYGGASYILNPDRSLKDGQPIKIRNMLYAGPPQTDESRVDERSRSRRVSLDNMAAQKAALEGEGGGTADNCGGGGGSGTSACAPKPGAVEQFMRSVGELSPTLPAKPAPETPAQGATP